MSQNSRPKHQQKSIFRSPQPGFQNRNVLYNQELESSTFCAEPLTLPKPVFTENVLENRSRYREDEQGGGPRVEETESESFLDFSQSRDDDETFYSSMNTYQNLKTPAAAPQHASFTVESSNISQHYGREKEDNAKERKKSGLRCTKPGCSKEFSRKDALQRHLDSVHKGMKIACPQCSKLFRDKAALKRHATNHHDSQDFQCDAVDCGKTFSSKDSLAHHKKAKHFQGNLFRCGAPQCRAKFTHRHLLEGHMVTHTGERDFECPLCGSKFAYRHNLARHKLKCKGKGRAPPGSGGFECKVNGCGKKFADNRCLKRHFSASHSKIKYMCEFCKTQFSYRSGLSRHACAVQKL